MNQFDPQMKASTPDDRRNLREGPGAGGDASTSRKESEPLALLGGAGGTSELLLSMWRWSSRL